MTPLTVECTLDGKRETRGRKRLVEKTGIARTLPPGRVPRVARLMALAIRFEGLLRTEQVQSYAELARLGKVTPARVTQIMNLLHLAPDIQEELLHLPLICSGRDRIHLRELQPIAQSLDWKRQRLAWGRLRG